MKHIIAIILSIMVGGQFLLGQPANFVWNTQSKNSSESMPCGGGDIGMNVWVEKGDILFYVSKSGCFDENNTLLKQGRFVYVCFLILLKKIKTFSKYFVLMKDIYKLMVLIPKSIFGLMFFILLFILK